MTTTYNIGQALTNALAEAEAKARRDARIARITAHVNSQLRARHIYCHGDDREFRPLDSVTVVSGIREGCL